MLSRSSSRSQPLPEKISLLLQEARWLILGVVSLYVGMILVGYSESDPGWSHASDVTRENHDVHLASLPRTAVDMGAILASS